ncbi:hypothetical protein AcV7_004010 [Taiwanofungus camphoratus]|nr:hypothetical protein AcV7_004010 [Antrodia cinnamomea]
MMDDFLRDSAALFGDAEDDDDGRVYYGPLVLTAAPKEGKANTLLADHLFSPSLLLAERIERGLVPLAHRTVIELGAGCALPSLLASTLAHPPSLVVVTDYPDEVILTNLEQNVARNRDSVSAGCAVRCLGYEWGQDARPLLALLPGPGGFDAVILSDLLHFDQSHGALLASLCALLRRTAAARAYVAAGKYTPPHVCDGFLRAAGAAGLVLEEGADAGGWQGAMAVRAAGLDREQLGVRKGMCRWWVGRWADGCEAD